MSMHWLENSCLRVAVADAGAELCSVLDQDSGAERLWGADGAVWNRHAPILFPFVGRVTGGVYRYRGREYPMKTQHGFARDLDFVCLEETARAVTHRLCTTEQTLAAYPFDFCLQVTHRLDGDDPRLLHVEWSLENRGGETMYFSLGGHPGFLPPPGTAKEDCFLLFPGKERLSAFPVNAGGFALPERRFSITPESGAVPVQPSLADTWIFEGQGVETVALAGPDRSPYVTLNCPGFPLLAVWAKAEGPFVCLEPWFGRTDDAGFAGDLTEKAGEQSLASGETRRYSYSIRFHR